MAGSQIQDPPEDMTNRYYNRIIDNMTYYASLYGYESGDLPEHAGHIGGCDP